MDYLFLKEPIDYIIQDIPQNYAQWLEIAKLTGSYILGGGISILIIKSILP